MSDKKRLYWLYIDSKDWMSMKAKKLMKDSKTVYYLVESGDKTEPCEQKVLDNFDFSVLEGLDEYQHEDGSYELSIVDRDSKVWQEVEKRLEKDVIYPISKR